MLFVVVYKYINDTIGLDDNSFNTYNLLDTVMEATGKYANALLILMVLGNEKKNCLCRR